MCPFPHRNQVESCDLDIASNLSVWKSVDMDGLGELSKAATKKRRVTLGKQWNEPSARAVKAGIRWDALFNLVLYV